MTHNLLTGLQLYCTLWHFFLPNENHLAAVQRVNQTKFKNNNKRQKQMHLLLMYSINADREWVSSCCSGFLSQSKDTGISLIIIFTLTICECERELLSVFMFQPQVALFKGQGEHYSKILADKVQRKEMNFLI